MSSTSCTPAGAPFRKLSRSACSAGRSLPPIVSVLPAPWILTFSPSPFSETASSILPLYSAAAGDKEGSPLFPAGEPAAGAAFGSAVFDSSEEPAALTSAPFPDGSAEVAVEFVAACLVIGGAAVPEVSCAFDGRF